MKKLLALAVIVLSSKVYAVSMNFSLKYYLNDTDLGWNVFDVRRNPLLAPDDFNSDLDGYPVRWDDFVHHKSFMGLSLRLMFAETNFLNSGVRFKGMIFTQAEDVLSTGNPQVKRFEVPEVAVEGGFIKAKLGYIHTRFSPFTLEAERKAPWEKWDECGSEYPEAEQAKGAVVVADLGRFIPENLGKAVFTLVAGKSAPNYDYPAGGQHSKEVLPSQFSGDVVVYLDPPAGTSELKKYLPYSSYNPWDYSHNENLYLITVVFLDSTNAVISKPVVNGRIQNGLENYFVLRNDRVWIKKSIFSLSPYSRTSRVRIEWSETEEPAQHTLYLNAFKLDYSKQFSPVKTELYLSYVNLHHDRNSVIFKQEAFPVMHSHIWSFGFKAESGDFNIYGELNSSFYEPDYNTHSNTTGILSFVEAKYTAGMFNLSAEYHYSEPTYFLNIAEIRYSRVIADDTNQNGRWDAYEKFNPAEKGAGAGVEITFNPLRFKASFKSAESITSSWITIPTNASPEPLTTGISPFKYTQIKGLAEFLTENISADIVAEYTASSVNTNRFSLKSAVVASNEIVSFKASGEKYFKVSGFYRYDSSAGFDFYGFNKFVGFVRPVFRVKGKIVWDDYYGITFFSRPAEGLGDFKGKTHYSVSYDVGAKIKLTDGVKIFYIRGQRFFRGETSSGVNSSFNNWHYTMGISYRTEKMSMNLGYYEEENTFLDGTIADKLNYKYKWLKGTLTAYF